MISAILLAAGQSKRMNGENKLIKKIHGVPLIKHSINNILDSDIDELIIVLGYQREIIEKYIDQNKKVKVVFNKNFKSGMSSSIKTGLEHLSKNTKAYFICLGDMGMVKKDVYNRLIQSRDNNKEIFVPNYNNQQGNPILFSIKMKQKIMEIDGDVGAKKILEENPDKILNLSVDDDGIVSDFNTQDSFMRF